MIICNNFIISLKYRKFIFQFKTLYGFKDLTSIIVDKISLYILENIENIKIFDEILNNLEDMTEEDILNPSNSDLIEKFNACFIHILENLKERGILTLLGIRQTPGSINNNLPSDLELLTSSFKEMHTKCAQENKFENVSIQIKPKPLSKLTVGARALCKHSHRASDV